MGRYQRPLGGLAVRSAALLALLFAVYLLLAACTCERVYAPQVAYKEEDPRLAKLDSMQAMIDATIAEATCEMHNEMRSLAEHPPITDLEDCDQRKDNQ